jgi:hypothetical protein
MGPDDAAVHAAAVRARRPGDSVLLNDSEQSARGGARGSAFLDSSVRQWDLRTWAQAALLEGHQVSPAAAPSRGNKHTARMDLMSAIVRPGAFRRARPMHAPPQ